MLGNKKLLFSYLLFLLAFRLLGLWLKPKTLTMLGRCSALQSYIPNPFLNIQK